MSFDTALRLTEILLGLAILQHSAEHLVTRADRPLFALRMGLAGLLVGGIASVWVLPALWGVGLLVLRRFDGPYNGGADKMVLLGLTCLTAARLAPDPYWQQLALAYLAVQLGLSYFVSGWVKLINADWRSGRALRDVFLFSAYPVSEGLRGLAHKPGLTLTASWVVIGLELVFPLSLLHPVGLVAALCATFVFHLGNACFFGLNRFVWAWASAYPALIWFQARMFG